MILRISSRYEVGFWWRSHVALLETRYEAHGGYSTWSRFTLCWHVPRPSLHRLGFTSQTHADAFGNWEFE
jgi:hypothetical protein